MKLSPWKARLIAALGAIAAYVALWFAYDFVMELIHGPLDR